MEPAVCSTAHPAIWASLISLPQRGTRARIARFARDREVKMDTSAADLGGSWQGQYSYSDARTAVPMSIDLSESNGQISGRTTEPNTFGDSSAAQLFTKISGYHSGNRIQFVKTYDGTGGQTHSVNYAGTIVPSGTKITGTWTLQGVFGGFVISR
jgi:hypothetical protein